ncbi:YkgJ family cysteine cluster protein [Nitrosopumilus sp. K4]|uniref:YkgJ family cysteine cluster protein n=1 Tax=Nitrosopumilus sp. K4 TaxID=2795383 RepID=UPI001BAAE12B|nr:YkgJ family cysteine cluster protein [Nitrosopumilus sp. K4]QUC63965.1 YkgJ family cysteine cluster protein [Nitrosopumilus sp. K4]
MEFHCVQDCSQCCIEREYYPSKKFGKIGVLVLPEEKEKIEKLAKNNNIKINIIPRIGVSDSPNKLPKVLAYQMMGIEKNGNTCPFLDTKTNDKSPHGGHPCKIYSERPLACMTYPLLENEPIQLDQKCKFCKENGNADENLNLEIESLLKIKSKMNTNSEFVWRYATGIGEETDKKEVLSGWILEQ